MALAEDEVAYDPTSSLLPDDLTSEALMMPKANGVLAGVDVALEVFRETDPTLETSRLVVDGSPVERGMYVAAIRGRMSSILRAERTALNFVQRMSGIATAVNGYVRAIDGLPTQMIDTRKTLPGWRLLDKYAVRMGGGHNHRMSTGDGILIKDNHIAAMATRGESMTELIQRAKHDAAHIIRIEVECDTLDQVREAVEAGADIILFDNMTPDQMREGVAICKGRALTEASGGITIDTVRDVAETGVRPALHRSRHTLGHGARHQPRGSRERGVNPLRLACAAVGLLALAACGSDEPTPTTSEPSGSQRIVLVGPGFDVWTVQEDGGNPEQLIGGVSGESRESGTNIAFRTQQAQSVRYTWPTWSPDGRFVALSRTPGRDGNALASLELFDADGSTERQLHETRPGSLGLVAGGAPHYALWAPTSEFLSFVAPRAPGQGLGLFSIDPEGSEPYEVAADAPLYHVWSPDGRHILVHQREQLLLHDTHNRSTFDLDADSLRYRVPAFSPDGERLAYVVDEGDVGKLVTSELDGTDRVTLMELQGEAAFAWSPAGGTPCRCHEATIEAVLRCVLHRGGGRIRHR